MLEYYICGRKPVARRIGGIVREGTILKKLTETALEHALKADVERSLLLMYKLHTSSMVSTEAIKR
jgi:hypothetical protein